MKHVIAVNDINPIIRKAGLQDRHTDTMPYRIILDYEFIYCESGCFIIDYSHHSITITSGQIAIITPDTLHRFSFPSPQVEAYWVHFDFVQYPYQQKINTILETDTIHEVGRMNYYSIPRPIIEILPHYKLPSFFYASQDIHPLTIFRSLYTLHQDKPYGWQLSCKQMLIRVILDMLSHLQKTEMPNRDQDDFIRNIEQYIKANIYRHLTVQELADHFHYHPDTLTRLFKSKRHQTLKAYISNEKIESSKGLLVDTHYPIETIAEMYGFTDRTYYSKVFKKIVGVSPSTHRTTQSQKRPKNPR